MSPNTDHLRTAGKITVYTSIIGVLAFALIFIFNLGTTHINTAEAQKSATTTVTVLNTPPNWTVFAQETVGSSTTTPTNAGDTVSWRGTATDPNGEDYYLLICDGNATPTPNTSAAPSCGAGDVQWGVSTATISGTQATVSTTTAASWSESNTWYAWICDGNAGSPRCNATTTQGSGTTSSPFVVNHRPTFTAFTDTSPADPGQVVTFHSTSSDPDTFGGQDTVRLIVCATAGFDTTTNDCTGTELGSTTFPGVTNDASTTYTIVIPTQDQNYGAYGYVVDNHGFEASGGSQGANSVLTVNNVAPTTSPATISINGGVDMALTQELGETTGFTLQFTVADNNSCINAASSSEISNFGVSLYRSGIGSTTCDITSAAYDPNNCYTNAVATSTWNFTCTASSTSCTGNKDTTEIYDCTFPLWYVADPTDATATIYSAQDWRAQVEGIDDNNATGAPSESDTGVDVQSFLAFALNTLSIPYGSLEPGQQTDPISATTTLAATGNVGVDTNVAGQSMCTNYTDSTPCPNSATSTIPEHEQVFATGTVPYASGTQLSSTTDQLIPVHVPKSTATSSAATGDAFWGIAVPGTITFAGDYTGQNSFTAVVSTSTFW